MRVIQQKGQRDPWSTGSGSCWAGHGLGALKAGVRRQHRRADEQTGFANARACPAVGKIAAKIRERATRLNVGLQRGVQFLHGGAMRKAHTAHRKDKSEDSEKL